MEPGADNRGSFERSDVLLVALPAAELGESSDAARFTVDDGVCVCEREARSGARCELRVLSFENSRPTSGELARA